MLNGVKRLKLAYRVRARKWDTVIKFFRPFLNNNLIHISNTHDWLEFIDVRFISYSQKLTSLLLDCAIYGRHHDQKSKDSAWNGNDDGNDNGNDNDDDDDNDGNDIEDEST